MRAWWLAAAFALAGCIGEDALQPGATSVDDPMAEHDLRAEAAAEALGLVTRNSTVEAPVWSLGDAWTVESIGDGERSSVVVTRAERDAYVTSTTSETVATYDAMFDISYLGRIRASDLAGSQGDQPVRFFQFPLTHGAAWTTAWDGKEISLAARFVPDIATPLGPQPGFAIEGTTPDGKTYVQYDYVPALRWWSHLTFAQGYGFKVAGVATNWTGEVWSGTSKVLLRWTSEPGARVPGGAFTVDADQTSVVLFVVGSTGAGPYLRGLVVTGPDHQPVGGTPLLMQGTAGSGVFETRAFPPKAGAWHVAASALHDAKGLLVHEVHQVQLARTDG